MLNLTKTPTFKMTKPPKGLEPAPEINNLGQTDFINPAHAANLAKNHKKVLLGRFRTLATYQIELLLEKGCEAVYWDYQ